jgi:hypothetical protein
MDARKDRIGEHAAEHALPWAVNALGPVPGHPLDRLDWQQRASSIGAYRELSGYDHPADPIGLKPTTAAPEARAAWYEALAALGPVDGPDVRGMPDGTLLHLRDTYPTETAWAPQWVGDEVRQVRTGAREAGLAAARAGAEAAAAERSGRHEAAARHRVLAASFRALREAYRERESVFACVMADRADWEAATRTQRHLAADAELRRRHPEQRFTPLRSAEPRAATDAQRAELTLTAGQDIPEAGQWIKELAAGRRAFGRQAGRTAEPDGPLRRPRLPRPRSGVPVLGRTRQGCDLAASEARDPPLGPGPGARPGPRRRHGSGRLTAARCILEAEVTAMAAIGITGMGLTGVVRMNWVQDDLAHVLEHAHSDETPGTWTGRACPEYGLALDSDVDDTTLRRLAAEGAMADLTWEAPDDIAADHGQVFQAAIAAYQAAVPGHAEELWEKVRAVWSQAWSANYAALEFTLAHRRESKKIATSTAAGHDLAVLNLEPAGAGGVPQPDAALAAVPRW